MLSEKMQAALNRQINEEMFSGYVYLAMAAAAEHKGLPGFANWFKAQYGEELEHADRIFKFILDRDGKVELEAIAKPELSGDETPLQMFESALKHEKKITQCIFKLKDQAKAESDHATDVFLEWFVNEQVEEEASAQQVVDQLRMIDGSPNGLFLIDRELAGRRSEAP